MTTATVKTRLTHKVGPFPVWAWAALAVGAYFLVFRRAARASGGAQLPYTPSGGSGAQQPASGQGGPADNGNADLLAALQENSTSHDALLAALQYGAYGGYGGYGSGYSSGGEGSAGGVPAPAAPTVDSGINNAPADSVQPVSYVGDTPVYSYIDPNTAAPIANPYTGSVASEPAQELPFGGGGVYSGPTPVEVAPAPTDTTGVITTVTPGTRVTAGTAYGA